ncbi:MAG: thiamine ABC transporter substrate-binding protein, partial [Paracoccaceae bacterium]|nr:thiamine ABC transporter substrate-binding protein [Paracoccaceae bacterium]
LADAFLTFLGSDTFAAIIPTTNWMYPAHTPAAGLPEGFEWMIRPETSLLLDAQAAQVARGPALDEWLTALSR